MERDEHEVTLDSHGNMGDVTVRNEGPRSQNAKGRLRRIVASGLFARSVEAAGIEPASRDISMRASTCVVG